ncbi:MAG TPA: ABC transporter substrate-binding protein, partial [Acidimicrobiales bacterium]|nr:ABC transporter substrate-binding protein [Acidimicrobiales bacterium]
MRIVSLLPSATEILFALGLGDDLEGVSFECDFPPAARGKRVVSGTALPTGEPLTAREVDDAVTAEVAAGRPIYTLDREAIAAIAPDLILAQDLCRVCAVPSGAVEEALEALGCRAEVVSLDPAGIDDVIACIGAVGRATGTAERAADLMASLRARVDAVRALVAGLPRPPTLALEWSDPPYSGGHWVPEMVAAAGGRDVLGVPGADSRRLAWDEVEAARPEVVVFMPCGYDLDRAVEEGRDLLEVAALAGARSVFAVDATA